EPGTLPDQATKEERADDDLGHVPGLLPDEAADRQAAARGEQVAVDEQFTEEDPRPPAEAGEIERSNPESRGGPDRRDRRRVAERLGPLGGGVVPEAQSHDSGHIPCSHSSARSAVGARKRLAAPRGVRFSARLLPTVGAVLR